MTHGEPLLLETRATVIDTRRSQLATLLVARQTTRQLHVLLAHLSTRLLALCVGETSARLLQHVLLVVVHVDRIWTGRTTFGMGIDFTGSQQTRVVFVVAFVAVFPGRQIQ